MVTENDVLAALRGVKALDGKPLPESGMIAGLTIRDDKVALSLGIDPSTLYRKRERYGLK